MTTSNGKAMKKLVAVRKDRNEKNHWTTIGVAFENSDGSFNLRSTTCRLTPPIPPSSCATSTSAPKTSLATRAPPDGTRLGGRGAPSAAVSARPFYVAPT